ncbi:uncharacterized protein LOC130976250 isoform X3 [Arachis stenosperma]|uniref:uncharacterized protein LOC130976250 isoform X3 n=1 Tax=Arachis stenosperma TaxID=217475 RepID=UPI0025AC1134|nr:uncharacterized protein LOC130976250 isoform X3 [Arachis stenosperma]
MKRKRLIKKYQSPKKSLKNVEDDKLVSSPNTRGMKRRRLIKNYQSPKKSLKDIENARLVSSPNARGIKRRRLIQFEEEEDEHIEPNVVYARKNVHLSNDENVILAREKRHLSSHSRSTSSKGTSQQEHIAQSSSIQNDCIKRRRLVQFEEEEDEHIEPNVVYAKENVYLSNDENVILAREKRHLPSHSRSTSSKGTSQQEHITQSSSIQNEVHSHSLLDADFLNNEEVNGVAISRKKWNTTWFVIVVDEQGVEKSMHLKVKDAFSLHHSRKRVLIEWNGSGQPIGESGGLLGGVLGLIASNFNNFPIMYKTWHKVPLQYKDAVFENTIKEDLQKEIGEGASENEAYVKVFGKENSSYVRGMGFGVRPSQMIGSLSRSRESMQSTTTSGPSRTEYQNLKLQVQLLQEQVNFLVNHQKGQLPPGFPTEVADFESPTHTRPYSSASHEPQQHRPSNV